MAIAAGVSVRATASEATRWGQLIFGIICMVMIANLQYGWTLFVGPIDRKYQWGTAAIQVAFSIFIATETWLVPVEGWFVDRYGPRIVVACGGVLVACAWALNSVANSLAFLYFAAALSGVGAGAVYGTCVGNALKWFPDRRGLAAGLTAGGFGAGAAATVVPIRDMIAAYGYEPAFLWFGLGQGLVVLVLAQLLRAPKPGQTPKAAARLTQSLRDCTPLEMLRSPVFWLLYLMFVMVSASGLMATAQIAPIAADFKLADQDVTILFFTATTLSAALVIDSVCNGLARPFFGWVSDHIGREMTMFVAFSLEAVAILILFAFIDRPALFVVLTGLVFFGWGEIFSLFPSTLTDTFGPKFAATNYGFLYIAQGVGSILGGPAAAYLKQITGSWTSVFIIVAALDIITALLAVTALRAIRARHIKSS